MPTIIRDLPFFEKETSVTVRGRDYPVLSYQIVLWVSVSHKGLDTLDASTPRFPAVLDTGFTHNFKSKTACPATSVAASRAAS